jgi:hypothetical protein
MLAAASELFDVRVTLDDRRVRSATAHRGVKDRARDAFADRRPRLAVGRARMAAGQEPVVRMMVDDRGPGVEARERILDDLADGSRNVRVGALRGRAR